jgi:hypothetical protein
MTGINAINLYGATQNERIESNRRAADTRRKLLSGAATADSLTDDESFLVGRWLGANSQDSLPGDDYRGSSESPKNNLD